MTSFNFVVNMNKALVELSVVLDVRGRAQAVPSDRPRLLTVSDTSK